MERHHIPSPPDDHPIVGVIEPEARAIIEGDLQRQLPRRVRDAMLDLVLAWARLDISISAATTVIAGMSATDGAKAFGKLPIPAKLERAAAIWEREGDPDGAARLRRLQAQYMPCGEPRNLVAHSACAGVRRTNSDRIVFCRYAADDATGNLICVIMHVDTLRDATRWARAWDAFFSRFAEDRGLFEAVA